MKIFDKPRGFFLIIFIIGTMVGPLAYAIEPFDHSTWDAFLQEFVNEKGEVDYQGALENPLLLNSYVQQIIEIDLGEFRSRRPREEELALWLNVYHVGILLAIRKDRSVQSLNEIPGIWGMDLVSVGDNRYSLNEIRSGLLNKTFRDEKIHLALSCGARSCPKFPREAFTGSRVEGQLFLAARDYVNDETRNQIIPGSKKIQISRIFKWYAQDFRLDFGKAQNKTVFSDNEFAVLSFMAHYLKDSDKVRFLEEAEYKIRYLPFDWSMNQWETRS